MYGYSWGAQAAPASFAQWLEANLQTFGLADAAGHWIYLYIIENIGKLLGVLRPGAYPCHGQHGTQGIVLDGSGGGILLFVDSMAVFAVTSI